MQFFTAYQNRPPYNPQILDDDSIVETAGFVPMKRRIENIMMAGQRLVAARIEQFDFPDGVDDGQQIDPIRVLNTDLADISMSLQKVTENLKTSQNEAVMRASEARKKVSESEKDSE